MQLTPTAAKDERYYRSDGDCIIQVENILFKIHRYHLSEDSPVFRDMFALPLGPVPSEGQQDHRPIVLYGDTSAQFRSFLSVAYSVPGQNQITRMSVDDLERLANIIQFAHKYLMQHCLLFALESIEHILVGAAAMVPEAQYVVILEATALCAPPHIALCDRIRELLKCQWINHITAGTLPIAPALEIAETFNFKNLLVDLYCIVLERLGGSQFPAGEGLLSDISTTHRLRIFSGHWFLSHSSRNFMKTPPTDFHRATCQVGSSCRQTVATYWAHCGKEILAQDDGSPNYIFRKLDNLKETMVRQMGIVFCPFQVGIDAAIAAFKASRSSHFFALTEDDAV